MSTTDNSVYPAYAEESAYVAGASYAQNVAYCEDGTPYDADAVAVAGGGAAPALASALASTAVAPAPALAQEASAVEPALTSSNVVVHTMEAAPQASIPVEDSTAAAAMAGATGATTGPKPKRKRKNPALKDRKTASMLQRWSSVKKKRQAGMPKDMTQGEREERKVEELEEWRANQIRTGLADANPNFAPIKPRMKPLR
eukprot:TRINITY_DN3206_c0_g1_i1.p2 TRINITY_DN3206_c0_g1~~TRINITY_DN3206_c0_g1_i1.p2  ORF type:complete len:200 (+),score=42.36 TRINITY_DN3206_c0_g1_i1:118-717(+)